MLRIFDKIQNYKDHEDYEDLLTYLNEVKEKFCGFCEGTGHEPYQCATKLALDEHFKSVNKGISWGMVKSKIKRQGLDDKRDGVQVQVNLDRERLLKKRTYSSNSIETDRDSRKVNQGFK